MTLATASPPSCIHLSALCRGKYVCPYQQTAQCLRVGQSSCCASCLPIETTQPNSSAQKEHMAITPSTCSALTLHLPASAFTAFILDPARPLHGMPICPMLSASAMTSKRTPRSHIKPGFTQGTDLLCLCCSEQTSASI